MVLSQTWAVVGGFISFAVSFGMGANNVSNAIGTCVGSGALSLKSGLFLAAIFEFIGSVFMGGGVTETLKTNIISPTHFDQLELFAYGMISTMTTAVIWLLIATHYALPISATQTIIGGIIGFAIVENKADQLNIPEIGVILVSWFLSPIIGALVAYGLYYSIYKVVLEKGELNRFVIPFYYAFTITVFIGFLWYSKFCNDVVSTLDWAIFILSFFLIFIVVLWKRHLLKSPHILPVTTDPKDPADIESSVNATGIKVSSSSSTISRTQQNSKKDRPSPPSRGESPGASFNPQEYPFKYLMVTSAAFMAFAHGSNDASNAAAPYSAVIELYQYGQIYEDRPISFAVMLGCGVGIVVGLLIWGYKTVEVIGEKITKLTFSKGYAAQFSASSTIVLASFMSLPISTTAVLVGSVIGVGLLNTNNSNNNSLNCSNDPSSPVGLPPSSTSSSSSTSGSPGGSGTTVDRQVLLNIVGGWLLTLVVGLFGTPFIYMFIRYLNT